MFTGRFNYHGREVLKGVNRNRPYPIISVETERNPKKREVKTRERVLTQEPEVTALALRDFLRSYMEQDGFEIPVLPVEEKSPQIQPPQSYHRFKAAWEVAAKGTAEQDVSVQLSASKGEDNGEAPLATTITEFAKLFRNDANRVNWRQAILNARDIVTIFEHPQEKNADDKQHPVKPEGDKID